MKIRYRNILLATLSPLGLIAAPALAQNGHAAAPAMAAAPLAESVPSQLPRNARPSHYAITITPDAQALSFDGNVVIDLDIFKASQDIVLNAVNLKIASATLTSGDGTRKIALAVTADDAAQTMTFTAPDSLTPGAYHLAIAYSGIINTQANGLFALDYQDKKSGDPRRGLFTQFEAPDARRFVPSFDEPSYKATFALSAIVPANQMAVSNMPAVTETPLDGGKKKVVFATSPKMSSYLLFFGLGDFERLAEKSESGAEVGIVSPTGSGEQARYALDGLGPLLTYYGDYFGQPYPLPKLDNIAGPGQSQFFGAMENWGAIFTFERILLNDPAITSEGARQEIYRVQAHEVGHQWFGDLVTMAWWDDLWLNEGFASWVSTKAMDHFHPEWQPLLNRVGGRETAMDLDSYVTTHPIIQTIRTVEDTNQAFDAITYKKGEAVITMLESYAGADVWRDGIRRYFAANTYGNSRTDDLWNAVEAAGAKSLTSIAHDFTKQAGIPLIRVGATQCKNGITSVALTQGEFSRDRADSIDNLNHRWRVPVLGKAGDGEVARHIVTDGAGTLTVPGCGPLLINAGQAGYYRTLYTAEGLAALRDNFATLDAIDQLGLLTDNFALSEAGYQPMGQALDLIAAIPANANQKVMGTASDQYATLFSLFDDQPDVQKKIAAQGLKALQPAMKRLGYDQHDGESALDTVLRSNVIEALGTMRDPAVLAEARRRFDLLDSQPKSLDGPLKIRWLAIIAAGANQADWNKLRQLAKASTSIVERSAIYSLLGTASDTKLAQQTLDLAISEEPGKTVSAVIMRAVALGHPDMAVDFVQSHQKEIDQLLDTSARARFTSKLAMTSHDPAMISKLEEIAADLPDDVRKSYEGTIAVLKERAISRPRIKSEVKAWLASR